MLLCTCKGQSVARFSRIRVTNCPRVPWTEWGISADTGLSGLKLGRFQANQDELVILGSRRWEGTALGGAEGPNDHMGGKDSVRQGG